MVKECVHVQKKISQIVKIPGNFTITMVVTIFLGKPLKRWFISIPLQLKFFKDAILVGLLPSQPNCLHWLHVLKDKLTENPMQLRMNSALDPQCPLSNSSSSTGTVFILAPLYDEPLVGIGPTRCEFPFFPLLVMYAFAVNSDISYLGGLLPFG